MDKSKNRSSDILNNATPAQRVMMLTLLGCIPGGNAEARPISYCKDIPGYRSPSRPPFLHGRKTRGKVKCIVDGDTFDVQLETGSRTRVRLWGIDCPESSPNRKCMRKGSTECHEEVKRGKRASRQVRQILSSNKNVTLKPPFKNNGNRLLSYVELRGGIDMGRKLIDNCICLNNDMYRHKKKRSYSEASRRCR